jgi:transcriptional regulator with XRE-family HTH domain
MNYELLKRFRISKGWTATQAAHELSITPQHLSRIENGRQAPSETLLQKMLQKYEVASEDAEKILRDAGFITGSNIPNITQAGSERPDQQPEQLSTIKVVAPKDLNTIHYINALMVSSDDYGIVIDAGQKLGPTNEIQIVSRLGFSLQHAIKIRDALDQHVKMQQAKQ